MIVCLCHAVNDRMIKQVIADGAETVSEVGEACKAGRECGSCCKQIRELIDEHKVSKLDSACSSSRLPVLAAHAR